MTVRIQHIKYKSIGDKALLFIGWITNSHTVLLYFCGVQLVKDFYRCLMARSKVIFVETDSEHSLYNNKVITMNHERR